MPEKEPFFWTVFQQAASIIYVVVLSSLTGVLGYMDRIRRRWQDFSWKHLALSFFTGGFNGYMVFLLCDVADFSWQATAFLTGAAGAIGSELLNALLNRARQTLTMKGDSRDCRQEEVGEE